MNREWMAKNLQEGHIDLQAFCDLSGCDCTKNEETGYMIIGDRDPSMLDCVMDGSGRGQGIIYIVNMESMDAVGVYCYANDFDDYGMFCEISSDDAIPFETLFGELAEKAYGEDPFEHLSSNFAAVMQDHGYSLSDFGDERNFIQMKLEKIDSSPTKDTDWKDWQGKLKLDSFLVKLVKAYVELGDRYCVAIESEYNDDRGTRDGVQEDRERFGTVVNALMQEMGLTEEDGFCDMTERDFIYGVSRYDEDWRDGVEALKAELAADKDDVDSGDVGDDWDDPIE